MNILLVNDDGYFSVSLTALAAALSKNHKVTVVAPDRCCSGMSHAMTFRRPVNVVRIRDYDWDCYAVSGTPADCVLLGLEILKFNAPDLIISGINNEPNLGTELTYSGTVNAAIEGSVRGIPSLAVSGSAHTEEDALYIVDFFMKNFEFYLSLVKPDIPISININGPRRGNKGHKLARMGERKYTEIYTVVEDGDGHSYTLNGEPIHSDDSEGSDVAAYRAGYATITPLTADRTNYKRLEELKKALYGDSE